MARQGISPPYSSDFDGDRELAVDSSSSSDDHGTGRRLRVVAIVIRDSGPGPVPVEASGHLGHDKLNASSELPELLPGGCRGAGSPWQGVWEAAPPSLELPELP